MLCLDGKWTVHGKLLPRRKFAANNKEAKHTCAGLGNQRYQRMELRHLGNTSSQLPDSARKWGEKEAGKTSYTVAKGV